MADMETLPAHDFSPKLRPKSQMAERSSFIPRSDGPGPGAYNPRADVTHHRGPRGVFGTSTRDHETNRYISSAHNKGVPPKDTPGPQYRTHVADGYRTNPKNKPTPSWGFGTARQRPDETKVPQSKVPGSIYDQQASWDAEAYSFAPPGDVENGHCRSREESQRVFISKSHAACDRPAQAAEVPGPGAYETSDVTCLSPNKRSENPVFGKSSRQVHDSMSQELIKQDPLSGTARITPGAVYDMQPTLDKRSHKFGLAPKFYSPESGGKYAGPYLGKGHETMTQGSEGPGPGAYTDNGGRNKAVPGLGDAPMFKFGTERVNGDRSIAEGDTDGPGPGAYNPKDECRSRAQTAPAFTLGSYIRGEFVHPSTRAMPGPGAYEALNTVPTKSSRAAAYTMRIAGSEGRTSFVPVSKTPGAGTYYPQGDMASSKKGNGFSFGVKENTISPNSMVSVRYQGPLGQLEGMGMQSPGPGNYQISGWKESRTTEAPRQKFGQASRESQSKLFISAMHAAADGAGVDSPGPGTYSHTHLELAEVTSRYRKPAVAAFSTSARFKTGVMTF